MITRFEVFFSVRSQREEEEGSVHFQIRISSESHLQKKVFFPKVESRRYSRTYLFFRFRRKLEKGTNGNRGEVGACKDVLDFCNRYQCQILLLFAKKKHFSPAYQQLCLDVFMVGTQGKLLTFRFYIFPTLIYISYFILDVQEKGKVSLQID